MEEELLKCVCGGQPQLSTYRIACVKCRFAMGYHILEDIPDSIWKPLLIKRWNKQMKEG